MLWATRSCHCQILWRDRVVRGQFWTWFSTSFRTKQILGRNKWILCEEFPILAKNMRSWRGTLDPVVGGFQSPCYNGGAVGRSERCALQLIVCERWGSCATCTGESAKHPKTTQLQKDNYIPKLIRLLYHWTHLKQKYSDNLIVVFSCVSICDVHNQNVPKTHIVVHEHPARDHERITCMSKMLK